MVVQPLQCGSFGKSIVDLARHGWGGGVKMTCFKVRYCQTYVIICAVLMVQSMYLAAGFGIILWFSTGVPPFVSWFINPFKYTVIAIYEYIYIPRCIYEAKLYWFWRSLANLSVPKNCNWGSNLPVGKPKKIGVPLGKALSLGFSGWKINYV